MHAKRSKTAWWQYLIPPTLLSLITALVYYPSLNYEFQFDDLANITKHFQIRHNSIVNLFFSGTRWISYWLNSLHYKIGRFDPYPYRVGNVIIHTINGLLVYYIVQTALSYRKEDSFFTRNASTISLVTALLFLVHPVQTQTVSYVIQGQLEGMACLFILAITLTFLKLAHAKTHAAYYGLVALLLSLGALSSGSKEIAIMSPVLVLLVDWFFVAQGSLKKLLERKWLHLSLFGVVGGCYIYFLKPHFFTQILGFQMEAKNNIGNVITKDPTLTITPLHYFISQFKVIVHYLWIFLWPLGISVEYDWKLVEHFFAPDCILPFLALVALATTIFYRLRKNSTDLVSFGLLWFFIAIAPRSTIVPSPELLVDYKTYPASLGWLLVIAAGLVMLGKFVLSKVHAKEPQPAYKHAFGLAGIALIAVPLSVMTVQRNTVWRSGLDFWDNMIKNAPGKARAYNNYGVELSQRQQKFKESIPYFQQAIAMDKYYPDPCNNLAVAHAALGDTDAAIDAMRQGLKINPYYPEGYNNLASFFMRKKDYAQAKASLETALRLRPWYGKAYFNLGRLHLELNEQEKAWECFKKCCTEADLDNEMGFSAFGKCSLQLSKYDDAIFAFNKILEMNPNDPEAPFNLGNTYYMKKEYAKALVFYEKVYATNQNDPRLWYNLGETQFSLGNHRESLKWFEKVGQLPTAPANAYLRIAACYETLEQPKEAYAILTAMRNRPMEAEALKTVKSLMADLEKRNPGVLTT
jgi:tetratricopeptide (TPR) repeat protein